MVCYKPSAAIETRPTDSVTSESTQAPFLVGRRARPKFTMSSENRCAQRRVVENASVKSLVSSQFSHTIRNILYRCCL